MREEEGEVQFDIGTQRDNQTYFDLVADDDAMGLLELSKAGLLLRENGRRGQECVFIPQMPIHCQAPLLLARAEERSDGVAALAGRSWL